MTKGPEIVTCIICGEMIDSPEKRIRYDVMCHKDNSWGIDIHRRSKCFKRGYVLLDEQVKETTCVDNIRVTATIGGTEYKYGIERGIDDYGFAIAKHSNWDHAPDEMTLKFLKSYKADNTLVFARIAGSNNRPAYGMPKLMSRDDPEIPSGLLDDKRYMSCKAGRGKIQYIHVHQGQKRD